MSVTLIIIIALVIAVLTSVKIYIDHQEVEAEKAKVPAVKTVYPTIEEKTVETSTVEEKPTVVETIPASAPIVEAPVTQTAAPAKKKKRYYGKPKPKTKPATKN